MMRSRTWSICSRDAPCFMEMIILLLLVFLRLLKGMGRCGKKATARLVPGGPLSVMIAENARSAGRLVAKPVGPAKSKTVCVRV
jgi:hypothetical protein